MARRGRPRVAPDEHSTRLTLALEDSLYDRAYEAAQQSRVSVPEMIRRVLRREFRNLKSTSPDTALTL